MQILEDENAVFHFLHTAKKGSLCRELVRVDPTAEKDGGDRKEIGEVDIVPDRHGVSAGMKRSKKIRTRRIPLPRKLG